MMSLGEIIEGIIYSVINYHTLADEKFLFTTWKVAKKSRHESGIA